MCFIHLNLVASSPPIANGCLTHIPPRGIEKTCRKKLHKCEGTFTRTRNKVQGNITLVKKGPAMLHVYF